MAHPSVSSSSSSSLKKGHHCAYDICAYDIHYHFVFGVKYRRALLAKEIVTDLAELVRLGFEISERYDIEIECFGADKDHVHLLCSAHPKMAPGQIARIYKSITARLLFKTFPLLKKDLS
jgi:putative transposase